ncbi:ferritin-like domain-containing protein [Paenibacillus sp. FSL K6-3182]|uniref:ferritin-like domain-containing protein n=1 Tax=Paenibacillus sp. FSL K6-3182 TaxID=2921495 RepID=UPI0030D267A9
MNRISNRLAWQYHLKLASTYKMLADKYEYMDHPLHLYYGGEYRKHLNEVEKHFLALNQTQNPSEDMMFIGIEELSKTLNGEYSAIYCYEQLANQAPTADIKNKILEIRNDEIRHFNMFSQIYTWLTGKQPIPERTEECKTDFQKGVSVAFNAEQETVDFYHEIARKTDNPVIKDLFTQAAADEQNHAVWFLYFMNHH